MPAMGVDVQVERHARTAQGGGKQEGVFNGNHSIVGGMPNETRRSCGSDLLFVGEKRHQFFWRIFAE
jgi:hypothetical protein